MAKIADLYADIRGDTSKLKSALNDAKGDLKNFGGELEGASSSGAASFKEVALSVAAVSAAIFAAAKISKEAFEFSAEGAQIASLGQASQKLAMSYGANMNTIVSAVQEASFNTITEYDAMKAANLAMTMGVSSSASEIANLMEIAISRGRSFGLSATESFDKITRGIGRRSIKILDDLGFNIVGATSSQDLFNKVLEQGNKELASQGGLMPDISTGYQRVTASYKELMNQFKINAAYAFAPFVMTPEELDAINKEDVAIASLTGNYEDWAEAYKRATGAGQRAAQRQPMVATQEEFDLLQFQMMSQGADQVNLLAESFVGLTAEQELSVGMSNAITDAQARYNKEIIAAKGNTDKQTEAFDNLNESYEDFIMSSLDSLGVGAEAQMGVAYAFGEIDDKSLMALGAINKINQTFEQGSSQWVSALVRTRDELANLDSTQLSDKQMTIFINYVVTGYGGPSMGGWTSADGTSTRGLRIKHGGSVIGGEHGMIVPAGFSNDGMPVMVSSGERLDVTPAGNNNLGGDEELRGMIADLKYTLDGLPIYIRDAIQAA